MLLSCNLDVSLNVLILSKKMSATTFTEIVMGQFISKNVWSNDLLNIFYTHWWAVRKHNPLQSVPRGFLHQFCFQTIRCKDNNKNLFPAINVCLFSRFSKYLDRYRHTIAIDLFRFVWVSNAPPNFLRSSNENKRLRIQLYQITSRELSSQVLGVLLTVFESYRYRVIIKSSGKLKGVIGGPNTQKKMFYIYVRFLNLGVLRPFLFLPF